MTTQTLEAVLDFDVLAVADGADGGEWTVTGLALPYNEELTDRIHWESGARRWVFAPGSAELDETAGQLFYGHDHEVRGMPIGRVSENSDSDAGWSMTASISKTAKGQEVHTLLKDGVLTRLSCGIRIVDYEVTEADGLDPLLTITKVVIFEVSVVPEGALAGAVVTDVLNKQKSPTNERNTMPDENDEQTLATQEDVQTLAASVTTLERQIATLGTNLPQGPAPLPFERRGEFIQALARGESEAVEFYEQLLAYTGGTTGDLGSWLKDSWVGDASRFVEENRMVLNLFGRSPLPQEGNYVEYGVTGTDTTQVGKQAAEGDVLLKGKITFDTDHAPVDTYGGWGEMTVQQITRSPFNVIEKFWRALDRRYAQTTEAVVRGMAQTATGAHSVAGTDLSTADGWIRFVVKCASYLDQAKGVKPEFILLDEEAFIDLALLRISAAPDAPYFLDRKSGTISITGLSGNVFDLPVALVPSFTADTVRVCHSDAIETFESAGAPHRLTDQDITNLTQAFSEYGFASFAPQEPDCIIVPGA